MKVVSTQTGRLREILWNEEKAVTGIFKDPVDRITVRKHFVEGDAIGNPRVHGGEFKAVYSYPSEHYAYWRTLYPDLPMPFGMFGENITTEGLFEDVIVGSVYRCGGALLRVTQPRMPCYKLAAKFGTSAIIRQFQKSRKSGIYYTVLEEGIVTPGDAITLQERGDTELSIAAMVAAHDRISE